MFVISINSCLLSFKPQMMINMFLFYTYMTHFKLLKMFDISIKSRKSQKVLVPHVVSSAEGRTHSFQARTANKLVN